MAKLCAANVVALMDEMAKSADALRKVRDGSEDFITRLDLKVRADGLDFWRNYLAELCTVPLDLGAADPATQQAA